MKLAFAMIAAVAALAASASELPVRQVVVFKNGIGFLSRAGEVEFVDGRAVVGRLPAATYGGLWVAVDADGSRVDEAVARKRVVAGTGQASSIAELLDANDGSRVILQMADRTLSGTLHSRDGASFALIESGGNVTAVAKSDVRSITSEGNLGTTRTTRESRVELEVRSGRASGRHSVSISSLERGIGWTPEYQIRIGDDGNASVELRAALINDAAELESAVVWFAVGYPSFEFAETGSPLNPEQSLSRFMERLSSAGWRGTSGVMSNVMSQAVTISPPAGVELAELPDNLTEGERRQDLFLYRKDGVTLESGERGTYALMSVRAPYTHVWNWTISDRSQISTYGYQEQRPGGETRDQVWHSIRLENRAKVPWTTGPALVIQGDKPIAQNTLYYTPTGGTSRLRLTVASDIAAEHAEVEKSRATEPLRKFGNTYEGLDYEGTLTLTNHRAEPVVVEVARTLTGAVTSAGAGGTSVRLAEDPSAVNPQSKIDWSVPVGAGETRTVTYRYRVWVRR